MRNTEVIMLFIEHPCCSFRILWVCKGKCKHKMYCSHLHWIFTLPSLTSWVRSQLMWVWIALCWLQVLLVRGFISSSVISSVIPRVIGRAMCINFASTWSEIYISANIQNTLLGWRWSVQCLSRPLEAKGMRQNSNAHRKKRLFFCKWMLKAEKKVSQEQNVRISCEGCRYYLEGFCFPKPSKLYTMILCRWSRFHPRGEASAMHAFPKSVHQLCKLNIAYQLLTFRKRWLKSICDAIVKLDENSKST